MIKPVAARIRALLEEDPSRTSGSLLLTGHSAGGAVASLLYAHMLSRAVVSELKHVTECMHLDFPFRCRYVLGSSTARLQTYTLHHLRCPSHISAAAPETARIP